MMIQLQRFSTWTDARQGNPISTFLFILTLEIFFHLNNIKT